MSTAVTSTKCNPVTAVELTLDKWRPITHEIFVQTLSDSSFYDGEYFIAPEAQNVELESGNAIVWCTCGGIDHSDDTDIAVMTPELMILTRWEGGNRKVLCFVHN